MTSEGNPNGSLSNFPTHSDFSKISPTAKLVAYFREFTDIPFAKHISKTINAKSIVRELCPNPEMLSDLLRFAAPALEARYKSMISAIRKSGIKQILELASGLSFRGLVMTNDPSIVYVETDLPSLATEKRSIISQSPEMKNCMARSNLFLEQVNAVSADEIDSALKHFDPNLPVAVIHEGLYMYLSREEKKKLAENIQYVLQRFGGVWITPDFMIDSEARQSINHPKAVAIMEHMTKMIAQLTSRDLSQDQFKDQSDLSNFLNSIGFKLHSNPQIDGSYTLSSLKNHPMNDEHFSLLQKSLHLWTLELIK
jgi:O-methyltransferase involved in polyketide biosynthesis